MGVATHGHEETRRFGVDPRRRGSRNPAAVEKPRGQRNAKKSTKADLRGVRSELFAAFAVR
jgi:hypothetical protein